MIHAQIREQDHLAFRIICLLRQLVSALRLFITFFEIVIPGCRNDLVNVFYPRDVVFYNMLSTIKTIDVGVLSCSQRNNYQKKVKQYAELFEHMVNGQRN